MHVEQSLRSIRWDDFEPTPQRASSSAAVIADTKEFRIRRIPLAQGEHWSVTAGEQAHSLSVVNGSISATAADEITFIGHGENVVLPYSSTLTFEAIESTTLLITDNFS